MNVLIWQVMSGNGVLTGITIIIMQIVLTEILRGLLMAPIGSFAAVAGSATPGAAALRIAPAPAPASAPPTSAFAF